LRKCLRREDNYSTPGKPVCDWDDAPAREALLDALARDAYAILAQLDDRTVSAELQQAARLLATVVGQDIEQRANGVFRILRGVAKDRVISTVDPEARHGHKTAARGFDGYKGHVAVDPESGNHHGDGGDARQCGGRRRCEIAAGGRAGGEVECDTVGRRDCESDRGTGRGGNPAQKTSEPSSARPSEPAYEIYGDASYGQRTWLRR